jgi:hypothetical protein
MLGSSWVATQLAASQEVFSSMKLVICAKSDLSFQRNNFVLTLQYYSDAPCNRYETIMNTMYIFQQNVP